jgi:hypothetical protein
MKVNLKVRIHSEYFSIQKYFIHNNIYEEKTGQWPTVPHSHPEHSRICHKILSVNKPSAQNFGLFKQNSSDIASWTFAPVWKLWAPTYSFTGPKTWELFGAKSGLYNGFKTLPSKLLLHGCHLSDNVGVLHCHAEENADGSWHCHDILQQAANEFQLLMCFCPEISHNIKDIYMRPSF